MKVHFQRYICDMKSLLVRNTVLIILINMLNQYGSLMKNSYRAMFAMQDIGVSATVFGTAISVFLIVSICVRTPAGLVVDKYGENIKKILIGAFLVKAAAILSFLFVKTTAALYLAFAFDSVSHAFLGVAMPALLALSIKEGVVGSAYALMMGISNIFTAHARSLGIAVYEQYGIKTAVFMTVMVAAVAAVCCLFLDAGALLQKRAEARVELEPSNRTWKGIHIKMLPLAFIAAMPIIMYHAETNFLALHAQEAGFHYLGVLAVASAIDGVNTILVGFLCDLINPAVFVVLGLLGCSIGTFLFAFADNSLVFCAGILIYYSTQNYDAAFRIIGMKRVRPTEQGALQATMLTCNEMLSIACAPVLGALVEHKGYSFMWICVCVWIMISLTGFLVFNKRRDKQ